MCFSISSTFPPFAQRSVAEPPSLSIIMRAFVSFALLSVSSALAKLNKDVNAVAYYDPKKAGGSMLTIQNEPMNVRLSFTS
jgi:hypothetical protein